jgi:hypothetical protein
MRLRIYAESVNPHFRQGRASQFEKQLAEVVDGPVWAPSADGLKDVFVATLDEPIRTVEPETPLLRGECPKGRADQRVLQPTNPSASSAEEARVVRVRRPIPAIDPAQRNLVVLPPDPHHRVAVEAAVPGEAIDFALGSHAAAERFLSPNISGTCESRLRAVSPRFSRCRVRSFLGFSE